MPKAKKPAKVPTYMLGGRRILSRIPLLDFLICFVVLASAARAQIGIGSISSVTTANTLQAQTGIQPSPPIELGIDVLVRRQLHLLAGKRVGLLTHPAGVDRFGRSAIDVLRGNRNVNLVALYGPEHGIYGDEEAGQLVEDRIDARTGLPVYSLYGKYRKPTPEMLEGIDVLVIDLQDIGVRSYTFVSCMKLAIEACFQADKEVIVLDRPNPLGGLKVDGPMIDRQWLSYVGAFPVPYVHGLTIGELARMAVMEPGILNVSDETRRSGQLAVVTMNGWRRYMSWPQTGLQWKPTSINVPTFQAAVGYAMTGLGTEIGGFSHGLGTKYPFRFLTYEDGRIKEAQRLLKAASIPGIALTPERIGPDQQLGLYVEVIDWNEWRPTEISFHMMRISAALSRGNPFSKVLDSPTIFNKLVGSTAWLREISNKGAYANVKGYVIAWERDARQFQLKSRRYWLYD